MALGPVTGLGTQNRALETRRVEDTRPASLEQAPTQTNLEASLPSSRAPVSSEVQSGARQRSLGLEQQLRQMMGPVPGEDRPRDPLDGEQFVGTTIKCGRGGRCA